MKLELLLHRNEYYWQLKEGQRHHHNHQHLHCQDFHVGHLLHHLLKSKYLQKFQLLLNLLQINQ